MHIALPQSLTAIFTVILSSRDDLFILEVKFCRRPEVDLQIKKKRSSTSQTDFTAEHATLTIVLRICGKFQFFHRKSANICGRKLGSQIRK